MKKNIICIILVFMSLLLVGCKKEDLNSENGNNNGDKLPTKETNRPNYSNSLKVLAIGNSFSEDGMKYLWHIADEYSIEEVVIAILFIGGSSLEMHLNNIENNAPLYTYHKITDGEWIFEEKYTINDGLNDEKWDIISLQQVSGNSGIYSTIKEPMEKIVSYIKENNSNDDLEIVYHMTWAYENTSTHADFVKYNNDQEEMYKSIVETTRNNIENDENIDLIIPTGTAIQNARTSFVGDNLTRDGFHLSYDLGRLTTAYTWFKALTGFKIDNLQYKPDFMYTKLVDIAKESANNAINESYKVTESKYNEPFEINLENYELLELKYVSGFWTATQSQPNTIHKNTELAKTFLTQNEKIHQYDLPPGSLIILEQGYQYRINYWSSIASKSDLNAISLNLDYTILEVDKKWWKDYLYVAFNISVKGTSTDLSEKVDEASNIFKIYVPIK